VATEAADRLVSTCILMSVFQHTDFPLLVTCMMRCGWGTGRKGMDPGECIFNRMTSKGW
jgi:hypothetical protein